jgi:hypothetical protein
MIAPPAATPARSRASLDSLRDARQRSGGDGQRVAATIE